MPGVGSIEFIIKSPEQNGALVVGMMGIDTEELFRQLLFLNAVVVV